MHVEHLVQDSLKPLQPHLEETAGALSKAKGEVEGENHLLTKGVDTTVMPQGVSMFLAVRAETAGAYSFNSMFAGQGGPAKQEMKASSFMPRSSMSYSEKKAEAAKARKPEKQNGLAWKINTTSMSVTGISPSGGKPSPIKGLNKDDLVFTVNELQKEVEITRRTIESPYENASKRLADHLTKGVERAEDYLLKSSPSMIQQIMTAAPNVAQILNRH